METTVEKFGMNRVVVTVNWPGIDYSVTVKAICFPDEEIEVTSRLYKAVEAARAALTRSHV